MKTLQLSKAAKALNAFYEFREETLSQAEGLLMTFRDLGPIENSEPDSIDPSQYDLDKLEMFIAAYLDSGLLESFQKEMETKQRQAEQVLAAFTAANLKKFNIFLKVGFTADENNLSDAIAALLDPKGSHGLGLWPLRMLLRTLSTKQSAPSQVNLILPLLEDSDCSIHILRERYEGEGKTIPDIEIVSDKFIIFIENKIQGGSETYMYGQYQTDRQWVALKGKGNRIGVPLDRLLGIFLTPNGESAKNSNFISLSVPELVTAFDEALKAVPDCSCSNSIQAFLEFYSWSQ
jgi:hypothetical protein